MFWRDTNSQSCHNLVTSYKRDKREKKEKREKRDKRNKLF